MPQYYPSKSLVNVLAFTSFIFLSCLIQAQAPEISWQLAIGGSASDWTGVISKTADDGFIAGGNIKSNDSGYSTINNSYDCILIKFSASGNIEWQFTYGGSGDEGVNDIKQLSDGSYVVAATSNSSDYDLTNNHGSFDIWIFGLSIDGQLLWQKSYGGNGSDSPTEISPTVDSGYLIAGVSTSSDGDVASFYGNQDLWIFKINSAGDILWQRNLGGTDYEDSPSFQSLPDGSFIFSSRTESNDGDVTNLTSTPNNEFPFGDFWLFKLDSNGNMLWQECLGGYSGEGAWSIDLCSDGGYVIAGYTFSNDGDVSGYNGGGDCWVVKVNAFGEIIWQNSIGGSENDAVYSVIETSDGGYAIAGKTPSNDGDVSGNHGDYDAWVIKLNGLGQIMWQKCLGGSNWEGLSSIIELNNDIFLVAGGTESSDGDVVGFHGGKDGWLLQLSAPQNVTDASSSEARLFPNPNQGHFSIRVPDEVANGNCKLQIRNNLGQLIYETTINGSLITVDTKEFDLIGVFQLLITDKKSSILLSERIIFE